MGGAAAPDGATGKGEGLSGVAARAGPEANAAGSRWEALDDKIKQFVDLAYHDGKGGETATGVRHWRRFCAEAAADGNWARPMSEGAPREMKLAEEHLVMRFACYLVVERGVQPGTAEQYVSTVQGWHARHFGVKLAGGMKMWRLKALLQGMVAQQGGKRPKKKRLGLKPRQLATLMARLLAGGTALEANWRACLTVGMCGLFRGAELGVKKGEAWRAATCVTRADVKFRWRNGVEEAVLNMRPRKKGASTEQGKQARVLLTGGGRFLDPVRALRELFAADPVPREKWAASPLFRDDSGAAFSTPMVCGVVKWMVSAEGGDPTLYGAHSLRIGGATAALAAGVPALVIKAMGRWGSDVYEVYAQLSDAAARSFGSRVANVDYDEVDGAYYSEDL